MQMGYEVYNTFVRCGELPICSEEIATFLCPRLSHNKEVFNFPVLVALNHLVLKKKGSHFL